MQGRWNEEPLFFIRKSNGWGRGEGRVGGTGVRGQREAKARCLISMKRGRGTGENAGILIRIDGPGCPEGDGGRMHLEINVV